MNLIYDGYFFLILNIFRVFLSTKYGRIRVSVSCPVKLVEIASLNTHGQQKRKRKKQPYDISNRRSFSPYNYNYATRSFYLDKKRVEG